MKLVELVFWEFSVNLMTRHNYDSYYSSSICGGDLLWLVNGNTELVHFVAPSRVSDVAFQDDTNGRSRYTSMIFSLRNTNNRVRMGVAMVVTQSQPDWRPVVQCRGFNERRYTIQYDVSMMAPLSEIHIRSVTLSHAIDVSLQDNYTANVLVCRSSTERAIWRKRGTFLASINSINQVGDAQHIVHTLDSSTVLWGAMLLEKTEQYVTTALFYIDRYDVGSMFRRCQLGSK